MEGWYQVDVILFKPTRTSLDAESWPEFEPSYPADVIAITEPRAFNLPQLEPVAELEAQGLADSTIVVFTSDHGDGLPRAKREVYDSGIRVPLIIRWPRRWLPAHRARRRRDP